MKKGLSFILFLILVNIATSQQHDNLYFSTLTVKDGLPGNQVNDIEQDSNGFIWIASINGLSRYDGFQFMMVGKELPVHGMAPKRVLSIHPNQKGLFLLNAIEDAYLFNPYTLANQHVYRADKDERILTCHLDKYQGIWIVTNTKVLFLKENGTKKTLLLQPGGIQEASIIEMQGQAWIFHEQTSVFDLKRAEMIDSLSRKKNIAWMQAGTSDAIRSSNGQIWLACQNKLISYNPLPGGSASIYPVGDKNARINCIHEDLHGLIWCGTKKQGAYVFDPATKHVIHQYLHGKQINHGISSNSINHFFYARQHEDGVLWIGTENGLNKTMLMDAGFNSWNLAADDINTRALHEIKPGVILAGSQSNGLFQQNTRTGGLKKLETFGKLQIGDIVTDSSGNLYISTWEGKIFYCRPDYSIIKTWNANDAKTNLDGWVFHDLLVDQNDHLWIVSQSGDLQKLETPGSEFISHDIQNNSREKKTKAYCIYQPDQSKDILWLGCSTGLLKFHTSSGQIIPYSTEEGCPGDIFTVFQANDSIILLGTLRNGLFIFNIKNSSFKSWAENHQLPGEAVFSIYGNQDTSIWISSNNGLARAVLDTSGHLQHDRTFASFPRLTGNEFNWHAHHQSPESGNLYIGGTRGIIAFHPDSIHDYQLVPNTMIANVSIGNHPVFQGDTANPGKISYTYDQQRLMIARPGIDLSITLASNYYYDPSRQRFQYILEGHDRDFTIVDATNRTARYEELPPGRYTFKARASNHQGIWNDRFQSLEIVVKRKLPLYPVFIALFILLALVFAILHGAKGKKKAKNNSLDVEKVRFTEKCAGVVSSHVSDPEFDNQRFIEIMGMSRSQLYRLMKMHTGMTVSDFIRNHRLEEAARLLGTGSYNVSEVAYKVGFKDPANFSRYFKARYGKSPSDYHKEGS